MKLVTIRALLLLLAASSICHAQAADGDAPLTREQWFFQQRLFGLGYIPAGARLAALQQMDRMRAASDERAKRLTAPDALLSTNWTFIGPMPTQYQGINYTSGRVGSIAIDPRNAQVIYIGGAEGGVWKTTDGGGHWTALTDTQNSLAIGSLALDPTNPDILYVGTGTAQIGQTATFYSGAGLLKSNNGGATFTTLPGPFSTGRVVSVLVSPSNGQIVFAGLLGVTGAGVQRSTDGGNTWTNVLPGTPAPAGLAVDPQNSSTMYAAMAPSAGIFKSTDGGVTWKASNGSGSTGLPLTGLGSAIGDEIAIGMAPSNSSIVYVSLAKTNSTFLGLYRTADGGATWQALPAAPDVCSGSATPQCWHNNFVSVSPSNPNVLFLGGVAMQHSIDGGQTWSDALFNADNGNIYVHSDQQTMTWNTTGTAMILGNDGGVWESFDPNGSSVHWSNLNGGLGLTQFYPGMSMHPTNPNFTYAGAQDNGVQFYNGTSNWVYSTGADGGWTAIDFNTPSTAYSGHQSAWGVYKTQDSGATWTLAMNGVSLTESAVFIPPLVIDPGNAQRLYYGTTYVYQTTNGAGSWQRISPLFPAIASLAVSPVDSNTVWAASAGTVKLTTNATAGATASWVDRSAGLPSRVITQVIPDPATASRVYVTLSGFNTGHIFRSTDSGATWTDISGNLPNIPVNDLAVDPDIAGTLYAATDIGVFFSRDSGATWTTVGTNLPRVAVLGIKIHHAARILRIGSHGRGMWDLQIPISGLNPTPAVTGLNPAILPPNAGATLAINGSGFTPSSLVNFGNSQRLATYVSSTQLTIVLSAADLTGISAADISVYTPLPGGGVSNSLSLTISGGYPLPQVLSLSPTSFTPGSGDSILTVKGTNFVAGSIVRWNGQNRATTQLSSTTLTAVILAADIANVGHGSVTVFTPAPGGGLSTAVSLRIGSPVATLVSIAGTAGVALDPLGNIYYSDTTHNQIHEINTSGTNTIFAGTGNAGSTGDNGPATFATFNLLEGLAFDYSGNLYAADTRGGRVRRISSSGVITTVASGLVLPTGLAVDTAGNLYIGENCSVRRLTMDGKLSMVAGTGACGFTGDGGLATAARVNGSFGVAVDSNGNIFIADSSNARVREVSAATGIISTIAGGGTITAADGVPATSAILSLTDTVGVDAAGTVFIGASGVFQLTAGGTLALTTAASRPEQITFDQQGTLYFADSNGARVATLQAAGAPSTTIPAVPAGATVNGASFAKDGVVAPWSLASLFGASMSVANGGAAALPLPTSINGTQVYVGGVRAPLVFVSPGQINFQVPLEVTGTSAPVVVTYLGAHSASTTMTLAPVSPGIFIADSSGQGAVLNQDYSANSTANPAAKGSVVQIFATGLGATTPPTVTGQAANSAPPFNATAAPTVLINGAPAAVQFYAAAPGFVGLYQVNATIPANAPSGKVTLQIQLGGRSSNSVTIAVK